MKKLIREKRIKRIVLMLLIAAAGISFCLHLDISSSEAVKENRQIAEVAERDTESRASIDKGDETYCINEEDVSSETHEDITSDEPIKDDKDFRHQKAESGKSEESSQITEEKSKPLKQDSEISESVISETDTEYITIEIRCDNIINNPERITNDGIRPYIPGDGTVLSETKVQFAENLTVFDVVKDICIANDIALDFEYAGTYSSIYIKAIGYIYEKDVGRSSGWMYSVNGHVPNVGCSQYEVTKGDRIVFYYSC